MKNTLTILILLGWCLTECNMALLPIVRGAESVDQVSVKTIAREPVRGRITALSLTDGVSIKREDGTLVTVPIPDLVQVSPVAVGASRAAGQATVLLPDGDLLYGRVIGSIADALWMETEDLGRLVVPLDGMVSLLLVATSDSTYRRALAWAQSSRRRDADEVQLRNGDVLGGFINQIDEQVVALDINGQETKLPLGRVSAIRFAAAKQHNSEPPYFLLTMRQSGRIKLHEATLRGVELDARAGFGERVRVPLERIAAIDLIGGDWDRLPQHEPISFEHTPMLSLAWTYLVDRNVRGEPLRVNGETYERGIGVHSRSRLIYDLRGEYRELVTFFGLDDDSGPLADVTVIIKVDDQRRYEQKNVRAGKLHGPVRLDVTKARQLELIVDFGEHGDMQDRFNWIDPALIK